MPTQRAAPPLGAPGSSPASGILMPNWSSALPGHLQRHVLLDRQNVPRPFGLSTAGLYGRITLGTLSAFMPDSSPSPPSESAREDGFFWPLVRQSLRGAHHDYTAGSLNRAVLLLAVPMVLEMVMESLFAVVDVFFVSRLGSDAVAVIGLTESVMSIVYAVAIGISFAATAIVARRIGEKDPARAAQAAGQILVLGATVAAGLGLVGAWWAPEILGLMGASDAIVALGSDFTRVMLGGNVTVFLILLINAIFRGAGDAVALV